MRFLLSRFAVVATLALAMCVQVVILRPNVAHAGTALQVSEILGAVKSAFKGKSRRRRSRRYRGSDTPVLSKPPALPSRRSDADNGRFTHSATLKPQKVPETAINAVTPEPARRPVVVVAAIPQASSSVSLPKRRPAKTVRVSKAASKPDNTFADVVPPPLANWQPDEISAAYDACDAILARKSVVIEPVAPMRKGACGMPAPVKLSALGDVQSVSVKPAATLNCRTVLRIHKWLEKKVQPAAKSILKSRVVRIRNVSSYSCRNRNNAKAGKLSEHALGNALDIASFVLADGRSVSVLSDWGTVKRDLVKVTSTSAQPVEQKAVRTRIASRGPVVSQASFDVRVPLPVFKGPVRRGVRLNRVPDPGGQAAWQPVISDNADQSADKPVRSAPVSAKALFLKQIHADACGIFSTVLGPEANDAHRDHFHFDTAKRRYKAYCR